MIALELEPTPLTASTSGLTLSLGVREYFAATHLWSAEYTAEQCLRREQELLSIRHQGVDLRQRSLCVASVFSAVAFLEALVNEVGQDAADHKHGSQLPSRLSPLSETEIHRIGGVWKDGIERVSPIDKFSAVSVLVDRPAVDRGREPGQSVDLLVKLRHTLVHYKPETQWDDKVRRVDKGLRSRIAPNPLMPPDTHPWYPNLLLSAACASWACETVTAFAGEWWSAMGFDYDYRGGIDYRDGIDG